MLSSIPQRSVAMPVRRVVSDPAPWSSITARVDRIELLRFDVTKARHFSFGSWLNRQHVMVRIWADGACGWGEFIAGKNCPEMALEPLLKPYAELVGRSVGDAIAHAHSARGRWCDTTVEVAEMALLDLAGRVLGKPTVDLLGLHETAAVPGLYCILQDDPAKVRDEAHEALAQGLSTHVKCKLFADPAKDQAVVRAVRDVMPGAAYVVGDVNGGYKTDPATELPAQLRRLHDAGLNGCEDPAGLTVDQWVELQSAVGELDLVPDAPVKNSARALRTLKPGMGRIYNIHPANTGSILDAVRLGRHIRALGARLMIGDDSLIGPACTAWQQLAIGLGAAWVETLEKPSECDGFTAAIVSRATGQLSDGAFAVVARRPGFGLEVDENVLRKACVEGVHALS